MTGTTLPALLPDWVRGWNVVDVALLAFLALSALDGLRRGLIAGVMGLAGIVLTIVAAFRTYPLAAEWLHGHTQVPAALANVAGFFAVLIAGQVIFSAVTRIIFATLLPARRRLGPLVIVDHLLGPLPGLAQGLAIAALVLAPLHVLVAGGPIGSAIDSSTLAPLVTRGATAVAPQLQPQVEQVVGDTPLFRTRLVEPDDSVRLIPQHNVHVDPSAEDQMLALLNGERTSRGLRPLTMDQRLREVARAHSAEMFQLGYFSHDSPVSGSPADRLRRAGLSFAVAGENLAYAPSTEVAHQGLMASPGHRANVLEATFSRVGIGVQSAGLFGRMFTQEFGG